jgi:hypothetical protein
MLCEGIPRAHPRDSSTGPARRGVVNETMVSGGFAHEYTYAYKYRIFRAEEQAACRPAMAVEPRQLPRRH